MAKRMKAIEAWAVCRGRGYARAGLKGSSALVIYATEKRITTLPGERLARVRIVEVAPKKAAKP